MTSAHAARRPLRRAAVALLALAALLPALSTMPSARAAGTAALSVTAAWARPTVTGQSSGGGFLTLRNAGSTADRLLSIQGDVARQIELHASTMQGDVMQMRPVDGVDVPAGQSVELKPGGMHLMFMELKAPLQSGARFPLRLRFQHAGEVTVQMVVSATAP